MLHRVLRALALVVPTACSSVDGVSDTYATRTDAGAEGGADAIPAEAAPEPDVATVDVGPDLSSEPPVIDPTLPPDCDVDVFHRYACCVFQGVNEFRQQHGVGLLDYVWDPQTAEVAQWYSELMRDTGIFDHGVDGRKCGSRMSSFDVDWSSCGENLARNTYEDWQESCERVVIQWAGSTAGHREAMLEDKWTFAGVGVAQGGGWWWTTMNFREP